MLHASIHHVDYKNVIDLCHSPVRCLTYSGPYPNYIWHIDSYHKFVRWRFVIHVCTDGFFLVLIYLKCANNNRGTTVVDFFEEAVFKFGLPDNFYSDHGGENVNVYRCMIATHEVDYSCILTGNSFHKE